MKHSPKVAVFTSLIGNYDALFSPLGDNKDIDFIAFTDTSIKSAKRWQFRKCNYLLYSSVINSRYIKMHPDELLGDYDVSVYIDANIRVVGDIWPLVLQFWRSNAPIALPRHPSRNSIEEEAAACIELNKIPPSDVEILRGQIYRYSQDGLPIPHDLTENNVIFYRNNHDSISKFTKDWFQEFCDGCKRDQISSPYIIWKNSIRPLYWDWNVRSNNDYFLIYSHNGKFISNLKTFIYNKSLEGGFWFTTYRAMALLRRLFRTPS